MSENSKWNAGTLTREDVKKWAQEQGELKPYKDEEHGTFSLSEKAFEHVVDCLWHLYLAYRENYPIGGFLTAVAHNNFMSATAKADWTNSKVLPVYMKFLYNCAPGDWKEKLTRQ